MKRQLMSLTLVAASIAACADNTPQAQPSLIQQADNAYNNKEYAEAIDLYRQALDEDGASSDLFYNLGNAYYRDGQTARAIVSYERALKYDPTNSDARENLAFVNERIIDNTSSESSYSTLFFEKAMQMMTANAWAITAIVVFAIVLILAAGYIFGNGVTLRKVCFFSGIILLLVDILIIVIALNVKRRMTATDQAIVTAVSTQLSTTPSTPLNTSQQAFMLHEGCKVTVLDSVATPLDPGAKMWYEVRVDDSHRAWINADDVEII